MLLRAFLSQIIRALKSEFLEYDAFLLNRMKKDVGFLIEDVHLFMFRTAKKKTALTIQTKTVCGLNCVTNELS